MNPKSESHASRIHREIDGLNDNLLDSLMLRILEYQAEDSCGVMVAMDQYRPDTPRGGT